MDEDDLVLRDHPGVTSEPPNVLHRDLRLDFSEDRAKINEENRTVELAFSSEEPVDRWFGTEILSHESGAIDFKRLNNGAALLDQHEHSSQIGVIEKAWLDDDKKARAVVRFSRSARGEEIWQDVKDGIRSLVSVGYRIMKYEIEKGQKGAPDKVIMKRWMPYEISMVSVPADATVGVGRADVAMTDDQKEAAKAALNVQAANQFPVSDESLPDAVKTAGVTTTSTSGFVIRVDTSGNPVFVPADQPVSNLPDDSGRQHQPSNTGKAKMDDDDQVTPEPVDIGKIQREAREAEQERIRAIMSNAERFNLEEMGRKAVDEGSSYEDFNKLLLEELGKRNSKVLAEEPHLNGHVDLTPQEQRRFSLHKLIRSEVVRGMASGKVQSKVFLPGHLREDDDAFEQEVCSAARDNMPAGYQRAPQGFMIPEFALSGSVRMSQYLGSPASLTRGVIKTDATTTGDSLIADVLRPDLFIEIFRNKSALAGSGMMVLSDLVGNVEIPRQKTKSSPAMTAEDTDATETGPTFDQVTLTPHRAAAHKGFTHQLLLQSTPDIETLLRADFAAEMALLVDLMGLKGTGSGNQPTGILNTTGINSTDFTTASNPTYAEMVGLVQKVMEDNAKGMSNMWIIESKGWAYLMTNIKTGSDGGTGSADFMLADNNIVGFPYAASEQMTDNEYLFGDFSQLVMGEWGSMETIVDPYTEARKHNVLVTINRYIDFVVRQPAAFARGHG